MNSYEQYYVYSYIEADDTIVYIGKGCKGRAWHCGYMRGDTQERHDWKENQLEQGRLPCDWVEVLRRGLSQKDALAIETHLIRLYNPILNKLKRPGYGRVDPALIQQAIELRGHGMSYAKIGEQVGRSAMSVHRWLNE